MLFSILLIIAVLSVVKANVVVFWRMTYNVDIPAFFNSLQGGCPKDDILLNEGVSIVTAVTYLSKIRIKLRTNLSRNILTAVSYVTL